MPTITMSVAPMNVNLAYTDTAETFDIRYLISNGSGNYTHSITSPPLGFGTITRDPAIWDRYQYSKPLNKTGSFTCTLTVTDTTKNTTATSTIYFLLAAQSTYDDQGGVNDYTLINSFVPAGGSVSTAFNTQIRIDVEALDSVPAYQAYHRFYSGSMRVTITSPPQHGGLDPVTVTYTPNSGFSGTDSFSYRYDYLETIHSRIGTVYITVGPPSIPVPTNDNVTTAFNTPIVISPLENDTGSAPLTISSATVPTGSGTVVVQPGNTTLLYTPPVNTSGGYTISYGVMDAQGDTATGTVHVSVLPAAIDPSIVISPATALGGIAGTALSRQYTSTGGTAPYTYSASSLPIGLSMSSSGLLAGTPTTLSTGNLIVSAYDSVGGYNTLTVSYSIAPSSAGALVITAPTVYGAVGVPLNAVLSASGTSNQNYVWTFSALPPGVSRTVNSPSVGLMGTPTSIGTTTVTVTVRTNETYPVSTTTTFDIVIAAVETTARADTFTFANRAAEAAIDVLANDTGSTFTLVRCTQPGQGVARIAGGILYYTPADTDVAYNTTFSYTAKDSNNVEHTATVTITVAEAALSEASLTNGVLAVTKNTQKVIVGANEFLALFGTSNTYISAFVSLTGAAHGVSTLNGVLGIFSYTPTTDYTGTDVLTLTVTSTAGTTLTATLTLTISAPPSLTITPAAVVPDVYVGDVYDTDLFVVQGGMAPYRLATLTITPGIRLLTTGAIDTANTTFSLTNAPRTADTSPPPFGVGLLDVYTTGVPATEARFPQLGFYTITLKITDGSAAPAQVATSSVVVKVLGKDGTAPDPGTNPSTPSTGVISGTLRLDTSTGALAARKVYLYKYTTGDKVAEVTSHATTGVWEFTAVAAGSYFVVGASLDSEPTRDFDAMGVITVT